MKTMRMMIPVAVASKNESAQIIIYVMLKSTKCFSYIIYLNHLYNYALFCCLRIKMDFENVIKPLTIRNNNQVPISIAKDDIIQISSESDEGEDLVKKEVEEIDKCIKLTSNNNKSPVLMGFTKKLVDIRECYEFLGLRDENPREKEELTLDNYALEHNYVLQPAKKVKIDQKDNAGIKQNVYSCCPQPNVCPKLNSAQRTRKNKSLTRRREQYQEFKHYKEILREMLFPDRTNPKLSISVLINAAKNHISQLHQDLEEQVILYSKEERNNYILRERLQRLTTDHSCWPYSVEVGSDKISVQRIADKFIF